MSATHCCCLGTVPHHTACLGHYASPLAHLPIIILWPNRQILPTWRKCFHWVLTLIKPVIWEAVMCVCVCVGVCVWACECVSVWACVYKKIQVVLRKQNAESAIKLSLIRKQKTWRHHITGQVPEIHRIQHKNRVTGADRSCQAARIFKIL